VFDFLQTKSLPAAAAVARSCLHPWDCPAWDLALGCRDIQVPFFAKPPGQSGVGFGAAAVLEADGFHAI
jgi:hypothetical protein